MKVLVCAVSHAAGISGVQRHALNLVRTLRTQPWVSEVHVVLAPWQAAMFRLLSECFDARVRVHVVGMGRSALARNWWHYCTLPQLVREMHVDLVQLTYPVPVNRRAMGVPVVVTLHDLYPHEVPANFGFPKCWVNLWILHQCLRASDGIACVSHSTIAALARYAKQKIQEKAVVVRNCVEAEAIEPVTPAETLAPRFLLCVAQHRRNKNLKFLLRVFDVQRRSHRVSPHVQLVLVGIAGPETKTLVELIHRLGLTRAVRLLEDLSDAELRWCYAHCEAVLAPSLTEGFGLPVVEALQQGCRVVCSDIPAFREFGNASCRFVRLERRSPEERFAEAISRSVAEPKPRAVSFPALSSEAIGKEYAKLYAQMQQMKQRGAHIARVTGTNKPTERQAL